MADLAPYIAVTDKAWFDFLSAQADDGALDEVNFWSPKSLQPMKALRPGEPVFFRLKAPLNAIAGYGFFAHFTALGLREAWDYFGWKNGDPDELRFLQRIGDYRGVDLMDLSQARQPLGCTILRDVRFWPREQWMRWEETKGWKKNIVRGRTEDDPQNIDWLMAHIAADRQGPPEELIKPFELVDMDERAIVQAQSTRREGQGAFRARLLDAYGRRCAITGERTELVLDAAHIQPYLGPRSNHIQNGLLMTKEFHTLFDNGYVTIKHDGKVWVSPRLRNEWQNGKRYYEFDGAPLRPPADDHSHPSPEALEWHRQRRFRT